MFLYLVCMKLIHIIQMHKERYCRGLLIHPENGTRQDRRRLVNSFLLSFLFLSKLDP
jgi:hypothetical protein